MKYRGKRFKSLAIALKELEPFFRDGNLLQTGRPFKKLDGMLPREAVANWLLCAALNSVDGSSWTFGSDPTGGDGIICDLETNESFKTEHVIVRKLPVGQAVDLEALILDAVDQKRRKGGAAYAAGKTLIVFLNAGKGTWLATKVARKLPEPLHFPTVWVVALQGVIAGEYIYTITNLDLSEGDAPTLFVRINRDFSAWKVSHLRPADLPSAPSQPTVIA